MAYFRAREVRRGDALKAAEWNAMQSQLQAMQRVRGGGDLSARWGAGGLQVAATPPGATVLIGTAQADIAPRSGATGTLGVLDLVDVDPETGAYADNGEDLDVVNVSKEVMTTGVSIKAGVLCLAYLIGEAWIVAPLDCS